ncbi:MAG TPA: hypothetical protein VHI54_01930 [Actinomycetota bacterium]|nr:hypothetical protein [Actinomycetota bacterium]
MSRELIARYWKAQDPYDPKTLAECRHRDWTAEWPQSGERVPSHENDVVINENYPGYPRHELDQARGDAEQWTMTPFFSPVRVEGSGELWIGEARLHYPEQGVYHAVAILELKDHQVFRDTVYFAAPFEAPEWRRDLVEPLEEQPDLEGWEEAIKTVSSSGDERAHEAAIRSMFGAATMEGTEAERRSRYAEAVRDAFHPDGEEILVASRERIRGLDRMIARIERKPDFPNEGRIRRIIGRGDLFVLEARLVYEDGAFWEAAIYSFRGDKILTARQYYAAEIEPPQWRSQWVERI